MKALKRFGQNFLINDEIAREIVESLNIHTEDNVVEVGPGMGILTKYILKKTNNVKFVEIDKKMCDLLKNNFNDIEEKIINDDVLKIDFAEIFRNRKIKIIGNFPYNITGKLIFKIVENRNIINEVVGMLQKEVVERLIAKEGSRMYGISSIFVQAYFDIEKILDVKNVEFYPKPKVDSTVCRLKRNNVEKLNCDENFFRKIVKIAFKNRRKTLKNNFKEFGYDKFLDNEILSKRAEMLNIEDFINVVKRITCSLNEIGR